MVKIIHLITGLSTGGAELSLVRLLSVSNLDKFSIKVISLGEDGPSGDEIRNLGIPVICLGWKAGFPNPFKWLSLVKLLKVESPDILQTWMYHADLAGGICGKLAGVKRILWNIRNSSLDKKHTKRSTFFVVKANAFLSHIFPTKIISCSQRAGDIHVKIGYDSSKMVIIPNGFDLHRYRPDPEAYLDVRKEIKVSPQSLLVGMIARFDPQKGHDVFVEAAKLIHDQYPQVHFLLAGENIDARNISLNQWIINNGLIQFFHLLGRRQDVSRITAAVNVAVSASVYGEAFSNVLGEAMSCEVPCVTTDVGDSAFLVGETGKVVPPHDHQALAEGIMALLEMGEGGRRRLGLLARQRIADNFELSSVMQRYEVLYRDLLVFHKKNRINK